MLEKPQPIRISKGSSFNSLENDKEMPLVDHIEELRQRVIKSLICVIISAFISLVFVRNIVRILEIPAGSIQFLQLAPGEFLFVSIKVAGYVGLTISLPYILFQGLLFVLPGLKNNERKLIPIIVAGSGILFFIGIFFSWSMLIPAALKFLINFGADVVEPIWSIEKYIEFVLLLMLATGLAFQVPILQLLLGISDLITWKKMIKAWRLVVISSAIFSAVLTPSTDPITMLILTGAIGALFLLGVGLVALTDKIKEQIPLTSHPPSTPN